MNKSIVLSVISLVVGLIALVTVAGVSHQAVTPVNTATLGGVYNVNNAPIGLTAGADFGTLPVNVNWDGGKIGAKSNVGFWKNTTGQKAYVSYVEASTDATASSSYEFWAYATSTAPRALYDFTNPQQNSTTNILINGWLLATSSVATTTTSDDRSPGAFGGSTVQVPVNSYLIVLFQTQNGTICASSGSGICESATSTNRGFNVPWRIEYHN